MKPWKSLLCLHGCSAARSRLQWGHGDEAVEELPSRHASRPQATLQWGHGDEAVEEDQVAHDVTPRIGFNGATAMKPWKRPLRTNCGRGHSWLQWGHGDEAVEETRTARRAHVGQSVLQWGHGDEAVEEIDWSRLATSARSGFNGATAMKPWKRTSSRREHVARAASMGPRR